MTGRLLSLKGNVPTVKGNPEGITVFLKASLHEKFHNHHLHISSFPNDGVSVSTLRWSLTFEGIQANVTFTVADQYQREAFEPFTLRQCGA